MLKSVLPTIAAGMVPLTSTVASLVSGCTGGVSVGASETTTGTGLGECVVVTAPKNPPTTDPTLAAALPTCPVATYATRTARPATASAKTSRAPRGMLDVRSIRRCDAGPNPGGASTRVRARSCVGRPVDGGRGRTWAGRMFRRVVIGVHCCTPLAWQRLMRANGSTSRGP